MGNFGIFGVLILIADIYAILQIVKSSVSAVDCGRARASRRRPDHLVLSWPGP